MAGNNKLPSTKVSRLITITRIERVESLEDLKVGDLIEKEGRQERVYKITPTENLPINSGVSIRSIHRTEVDQNYPNRRHIGESNYWANLEMLKNGGLHQNAWLGANKGGSNFQGFGMKTIEAKQYRDFDNFLRKYEGKPLIVYGDELGEVKPVVKKGFVSRLFERLTS